MMQHAPQQNSARPLTRRQWLSHISMPAMAIAAFGSVGVRETEAQPANPTGVDLGARIYNVRDFGAKGDGKTLDTAALQAAIDACTGAGGGTVLVPAGTFL